MDEGYLNGASESQAFIDEVVELFGTVKRVTLADVLKDSILVFRVDGEVGEGTLDGRSSSVHASQGEHQHLLQGLVEVGVILKLKVGLKEG